ncbi:hypothetical protein NDU88_005150 [Pleurodeles waltl]|uniref:Uncharacterized protein n=1 Tax=Pleurodeles waltl TaxID=8319 RepID=A0AAV7UHB8_PLEWA|nr:hypothetical protein NDU88_005150 [Pleurodeles waltl]
MCLARPRPAVVYWRPWARRSQGYWASAVQTDGCLRAWEACGSGEQDAHPSHIPENHEWLPSLCVPPKTTPTPLKRQITMPGKIQTTLMETLVMSQARVDHGGQKAVPKVSGWTRLRMRVTRTPVCWRYSTLKTFTILAQRTGPPADKVDRYVSSCIRNPMGQDLQSRLSVAEIDSKTATFIAKFIKAPKKGLDRFLRV